MPTFIVMTFFQNCDSFFQSNTLEIKSRIHRILQTIKDNAGDEDEDDDCGDVFLMKVFCIYFLLL